MPFKEHLIDVKKHVEINLIVGTKLNTLEIFLLTHFPLVFCVLGLSVIYPFFDQTVFYKLAKKKFCCSDFIGL